LNQLLFISPDEQNFNKVIENVKKMKNLLKNTNENNKYELNKSRNDKLQLSYDDLPLLIDNELYFEKKNKEDDALLIIACEKGNINIIKHLIEKRFKFEYL